MTKPARSVAFAIALCVFSLSLLAAPKEYVRENASGTTIEFQALVPAASLVVTIAGPDDYYFAKTIEGNHATINLADAGISLSDGTYTYDVRVTPIIDGATRALLNQARANNDAKIIRDLKRSGRIPSEAQVYSSSVTLSNGSIIPKGQTEPTQGKSDAQASIMRRTITPNQNNVADNMAVQGSLCVGLDCSTLESFGYDTIRLKENNLRIAFNDTSTSAGYATNDWQLSANETTSGGAEKFMIEDVTNSKIPFAIAASAPSNSLYVASDGKVGVGTSSPGKDFQVTSGDTPTLRLYQTNATYAAQSWDLYANEANIYLVDDSHGTVPLRIQSNAPSNTLFVKNNGNVGLGTGSPAYKLDVSGDARFTGNVTSASTKAGIVPLASFGSTSASVTFTTPFPNTNYSVALTAVTTNGNYFSFTVKDKTANGFTINRLPTPASSSDVGGSTNLSTDPMNTIIEVDWTATAISNS